MCEECPSEKHNILLDIQKCETKMDIKWKVSVMFMFYALR